MNCQQHPWVPLTRGACRRCAEVAKEASRLLPCPNCHERRLTRQEHARGFQCIGCTRREEAAV